MTTTTWTRTLAIGACAAVATWITWAPASGVVTLYPATLTEVIDLPSETVAFVRAYALPPTGSKIEHAVTITPGTPGPHAIDVTVNGGDPANDSDPGLAYTPTADVYLTHTHDDETYLHFAKTTKVTLDNTAAAPSASAAVTFASPTLHHTSASVTVVGAVLTNLQIYSVASNTQLHENYESFHVMRYPVPATNVRVSAPMLPNEHVTVHGVATLLLPDGTPSSRDLAPVVVNLGQGDGEASWTIDATTPESLHGEIQLVAAATSSPPSNYYVYYDGTSSATNGISGNVQVSTLAPSYSLALPPGGYTVHLRTYFEASTQYAETNRQTVTITAGTSTALDFRNALAVIRQPTRVTGFFDVDDVLAAQLGLHAADPGRVAHNSRWSHGEFASTVPAGRWSPYFETVRLKNASNPALPMDSTVERYSFTDPSMPPMEIEAGSDTSPWGEAAFTLVKSNIYFDVTEPTGTASVNVMSPTVTLNRNVYNADGTMRSQSHVLASGSSTPQPISGMTLVAEPGEYTLEAHAFVNGTVTLFAGTTIRFGTPVQTSPGAEVDVKLTPRDDPKLRVDLTFDQVDHEGISAVVETALGPKPPEGFGMLCEDNRDLTCPPIYYDISTTARADDPELVTICIQRTVTGNIGGLADHLHLYHYDETVTTGDKWVPLDAPDGVPGAIDCGDGLSEHLGACHCDEDGCDIDLLADPPRDMVRVCGVTSSFSQFAVLKDTTVTFTNVVDGQTYTGPTGPPDLQHWTAPGTGTYRITATGAQGASGKLTPSISGGCGALIAGDFALAAGDPLQILVGQRGTAADNNAGGGGGTFVVKNGAPLVIAGGGGGVRSTATVNGRDGTTGSTGVAGSATVNYSGSFIAGGVGGAGGLRAVNFGNGGGGWSGDGGSDSVNGEGGFSFLGPNRGRGGTGKDCGDPAPGGYGGGGAGNGCYGGGGGGGFSGGGGGRVAGGGGSLNNGLNPVGGVAACLSTGNGQGSVTIEQVAH